MRIQSGIVFTEVPGDEDYAEKGLKGRTKFQVIYENTPDEVGRFCLEPLPGCCGVVVSTESFLSPSWRGHIRVGDEFHTLKKLVAQHFGYSAMIMTTQLRNIPEVVSSSKHGWKFHHFFRNKRTGNDIGVAIRGI